MTRPRRTTRVALALLAVLSLLAAACGDDGDAQAEGSDSTNGNGSTTTQPDARADVPPDGLINKQPEVEPVRGGRLTFATYSATSTLDPAKSPGQGSAGGIELNAIFDTLMRYDTATKTYVPQLAEDLTASDDYKTWTLKLRPGVTFTDGTPLDSAAVVASLQRMVDMKARTASLIQAATSMETPDPLTVVFRLDEPWSGFPYVLASVPGNIVSPTAAAAAGDDFASRPVGAGPFMVEEFRPGEALVLKANPNYWAGEPYLEGVTFVHLADGQTTLDALNSGDVQIALLREDKVVDAARKQGLPGFLVFQNQGSILYINHGRNGQDRPGKDIRVRQAIAAAIDPELVDERVSGGVGYPGSRLFGELSAYATKAPGPEYNPERAAELLQQAKADGYDGKLTLLGTNSPTGTAQALAIQAQLQAVGFEVILDTNNATPDFIRKSNAEGAFDIALTGTTVFDDDPYVGMVRYYQTGSSQNLIGYSNPKMDELLERLRAAATPDERQAVIEDLQTFWTEDVPSVVLGAIAGFIAWDDSVHGVETTMQMQVLLGKAFIAR